MQQVAKHLANKFRYCKKKKLKNSDVKTSERNKKIRKFTYRLLKQNKIYMTTKWKNIRER